MFNTSIVIFWRRDVSNTNISYVTMCAYSCTQMAEITAELENVRSAHDMALAREKELQAQLNEARRRAEEFENQVQVLQARKEVKVGLVLCNSCGLATKLRHRSRYYQVPLECVLVDILPRRN
jgi:hypothetical protein